MGQNVSTTFTYFDYAIRFISTVSLCIITVIYTCICACQPVNGMQNKGFSSTFQIIGLGVQSVQIEILCTRVYELNRM